MATATGTISPGTLPPAGGTATGALAIQSPASLPSRHGDPGAGHRDLRAGLGGHGVGRAAQRGHCSVSSAGGREPEPSVPSPALSAFFPITPTRTYQTTALTTGTVHLDILAGRETVRGQTGGSEPVSIDAGGGVTLSVPAHALPVDTAVRVQPAILSGFLPGASANTAPADVTPLGEVVIDFASQQLQLSAELSIAAPAGVAGTPSYLVGRVVRIDGIPRVLIVARAEIAGDRLVSRSLVGLPGITVIGRYVFYRRRRRRRVRCRVLSAGGAPVAGLIESDSLPFVGLAGSDGHFVVATRATDVQLTGRVSGTALQGTATVTVAAGAIAARDVRARWRRDHGGRDAGGRSDAGVRVHAD